MLKSNQGAVRKAHVFVLLLLLCINKATFARSTYLPRAGLNRFRPGTSLEALAATSMPLRRWSHGSKGDNSALRLVGSVEGGSGVILGVAVLPANGLKLGHRPGGHSRGENADMSSVKAGDIP